MQVEPTGITTRDWIGWVISGAGVVVYILTLIVIYIYTRETRKMQRAVTKQAEAANQQIGLLADQIQVSHRQLDEMGEQSKIYRSQAEELIHQTRLSFMPAFIAEIVQVNEPDFAKDFGYRLRLTNVGRGVALSINVDNVPMPLDTLDEDPPIKDEGWRRFFLNRQVVFEQVPFVKSEQEVTLQHRGKSGEEDYSFDLFGDMVEKYAGERVFEVHVRFSDVEGNNYEQVIFTGKGGCRPGPVRTQDNKVRES